MALNREQRRAMMAQELEGDEREVAAVDAVDPVVTPPSPVVSLTADQLQQIITSAVTAAVQATSHGPQGDIASAITDALRHNRTPIPENDASKYHGVSHYNPEGKDVPRPALPCEMWLGVWNEDTGRATPWRELEPDMLTNDEIRGLSQIEPGVYGLTKSDGRPTPVRVTDDKDAFGNLRRRVIAFTKEQLDREHKNELGTLVTFHQRLVAVA